MICHNCIHVINRSMGPIGEEYHYCEIDGFPIISPIASCSRFDKVVVPDLPSVEPVLETPTKEDLAALRKNGWLPGGSDEILYGLTLPPPEPEGFKCDVCGKMVKTKLALVGHKRSHKGK